MKDLAIIMLDWNGAEDTIECLESIKNYSLYDIYLLDNGSKFENSKILIDFLSDSQFIDMVEMCSVDNIPVTDKPIVYVHSDYNYGFAGGNNLIAKKICDRYRYILLLNNDTVVPQGTIESMLKTAIDKKTIALTCDIRFFYKKDELWNAGGYFTILGERKYYSQKRIDRLKNDGVSFIDAPFITGCAMLIISDYISKNGLFTDKFFHGEEDFNFCYKLKQKNLRTGVDISVLLYHKVGRTINKDPGRMINSMVVHYTNRVIDFKEFYSKPRWSIWKRMYILLAFVKRCVSGMRIKDAFRLCRKIKYYSNTYQNVDKTVFEKIMQSEF